MSSNWINRKQRQELYTRDNFTCCYCNEQVIMASLKGMTRQEQIEYMRMNAMRIATLDHIIARFEDSSDITNPAKIVTVCNRCNSSKKHTPLETWCNRKGFNFQDIVNRIEQRIAA